MGSLLPYGLVPRLWCHYIMAGLWAENCGPTRALRQPLVGSSPHDHFCTLLCLYSVPSLTMTVHIKNGRRLTIAARTYQSTSCLTLARLILLATAC